MRDRNLLYVIFILVILGTFLLMNKSYYLREKYPKVWAHRVNDLDEVVNKARKFKGVEVDLYFSEYDNCFYVAHDAEDTIKKVSFSTWLSQLSRRKRKNTYYWLDIKNLSIDNVASSCEKLHELEEKYEIKDLFWVESYVIDALEIVKKDSFKILLWVDNLAWNPEMDEATWYEITKERVERLNPDGLSCEFSMYPLLTDSFPEENIFFWHTPADFTPKNVAYTQKLCRENAVKAVLVDYDNLIKY